MRASPVASRRRRSAENDSLIVTALNLFNGTIVDLA
jgi:hypothetical protein